jgi:hypothetical protein
MIAPVYCLEKASTRKGKPGEGCRPEVRTELGVRRCTLLDCEEKANTQKQP